MPDEDKGTYAEQFGSDFQQHILAVAARTPGFILRYRSALDHVYFSAKLDRTIAKALLEHVDEYRDLPTRVTLAQSCKELVGDATAAKVEQRVEKLYKVDTSDATAVMAKTVEFGKQQAMINAVLNAGEQIDKGDRNVMPVIQEAQLVGEDILHVGLNYRERLALRVEYYTTPPEERLEADVVPTGIAHLDYALDGGLSRGELGVVLAPPKRGKTTTLINFGWGALASVVGFKVIHYTFEIQDKKVERRYDDRTVGKMVEFKKSDPKKYVKRLKKRLTRYIMGDLIVRGYPTRKASSLTIRNHLSVLASQGWFADLIIVDYADIMKPERRLGEMRHEQAGIYEDLRQIAGEYNAACWTASQAPRGALEKETLNLGDFAEAFEKAAIVDVAIGFCQTADERMTGTCRLALMGLRSMQDGRMVECAIKRRECAIHSLRLLDASRMPVPTPLGGADDDDEVSEVETTVTLRKAADNVKAKMGIKKKPHFKGTKKKPGVKRKKKPSKKVGG